ncbi:MAG: hypothetical protein JXB25_09665 [Deltaproteobacteria bacterium]|nr:hypothetical protein [Deltaproteobacteria bacterium]
MNKEKALLLFLILVISPFFFFFGPGYGSSRSFQNFWDLGHILFFALAAHALVLFSEPLRRETFHRQLAWIVGLTLGCGLVIELIQGGFSRTPDVGDMLRNLVGALFSLFFFNPANKEWPAKRRHGFRWLILGAILAAAIPGAVSWVDEGVAEAEFPILADFETPFQKSRWTGGARRTIRTEMASSGRRSMKVDMDTSTYSGVSLEYFPGDWQGFSTLALEVFNPQDEPLQITCRIHDQRHTRQKVQEYGDRFNKSYVLKKGWNAIRIDLEAVERAPRGRKMELSEIRGLGIFAVRLPEPRTIYIDHVRLLAGTFSPKSE